MHATAALATAAALFGGIISPAATPAGGADWPQWRGPDHNGVTPERSGWPAGWQPKKLWGRNVGAGAPPGNQNRIVFQTS